MTSHSKVDWSKILSDGWATTCGVYSIDYRSLPEQPKEKRMYVYDLILVNKDTDEVIRRECVIGENETDAMALITLTEEEKTMRRKKYLAIVIMELGDYKPIEVSEVKIRT